MTTVREKHLEITRFSHVLWIIVLYNSLRISLLTTSNFSSAIMGGLFLACLLLAVPILVIGSPITASKVGIALYYESMCGGCREFILDQLYPTYQKVGGIMDITLVPYGNAVETRSGSEWKFNCQHGPEECVGNLIETCAISILRNTSAYLPFIHCLELYISYGPLRAAEQCASQLRIDFAPINKCQRGAEGNALEHAMAQKTNSLYPRHQFVPWITLNGKHTYEIQNEATSNLLNLVCNTYQGPKPSACQLVTMTSIFPCFKNA